MRNFGISIFFILIILIFDGCTKYPENKLWFKDPAKIFKGGLITTYTINDADHMQDIRNMYRNFPFNYFGKPVDDVLALPFSYDGSTLSCDYGSGTMKFSKSGKDVEINFDPINSDQGAQSIFIAPASWKILKLTKKGQLKIKAVIFSKVYEIQFN